MFFFLNGQMEVSYNATKSELIRAKEAAHVEKMEKLATVEQIGSVGTLLLHYYIQLFLTF